MIGRPPHLDTSYAEVYDWLAANGIDEWLPENPTVTIAGDRLTYTAFRFRGERGWDVEKIVFNPETGMLTEDRTVPLVVPPTDRIRFLAARIGMVLVEEPDLHHNVLPA